MFPTLPQISEATAVNQIHVWTSCVSHLKGLTNLNSGFLESTFVAPFCLPRFSLFPFHSASHEALVVIYLETREGKPRGEA